MNELMGLNVVGDNMSTGVLAAATTIIVEVLKQVLPSTIPTQILTLAVSIIVSLVSVVIFGTITGVSIISSILQGFFVAYVSMYGYDTMKELTERVMGSDNKDE